MNHKVINDRQTAFDGVGIKHMIRNKCIEHGETSSGMAMFLYFCNVLQTSANRASKPCILSLFSSMVS